jgi:hypothetical protein
MVGPVGLAKRRKTSEIVPIEAKTIFINSAKDFIACYPPSKYDLYFYEINNVPSHITQFKYSVRFAVIEKE